MSRLDVEVIKWDVTAVAAVDADQVAERSDLDHFEGVADGCV